MWSDENHVRIRFGGGSLNGIGDSVQGRSYCLVTHDEPIIHDIALRHGTPHGLAGSFSLAMVMRSAIGASPACDLGLRRFSDRICWPARTGWKNFSSISVSPSIRRITGSMTGNGGS